MKNYEWINNMAKVDLLYLIESNWAEGRCIVNQLNNNEIEKQANQDKSEEGKKEKGKK